MPSGNDENATPAIAGKAWLELPGLAGNQEYVKTAYGDPEADNGARNYSYNYDKDTFTSLWVAYPLYPSIISGENSAGWKENPDVPDEYEVNIYNHSYGVNVGSTTKEGYNDKLPYYARGHQIANADRKSSAKMNSQTYYVTNSTPQNSKFNGGIWSSLEQAVRNTIPASDTLYVVTGAAFQKNGEPEKEVVWILPQDETVKQCPVPNYYWKVLLKVKRNSEGVVIDASSVGFWFEHKFVEGDAYANHVVAVDQIEQWTGFDFFVNLADSIESLAETNTSWTIFQNY